MGNYSTPRPGQPLDFSWLTSLLGSVAQQSPVSQLTSLPMGLPASGINATAGPEVLYASGMFDPSRISALVEDRYNQLLAEHQIKLADIYGDLPLPPSQTYSYQTDSYFSARPEVGEVFSDIIRNINEGGLATPAEAKNALMSLASNSGLPQALRTQLANDSDYLSDVVDSYFRERGSYARDMAEYEQKYGSARQAADAKAAALGISVPTKQQAYGQVVTDLGAPQLAALPSPTEQFELPLSQFADTDALRRLESEFAIGRSKLSSPRMDVARRALEQQNKLAQSYQGRANQELARQFAEQQTSGYSTRPKAGDIAKGVGLTALGGLLAPFTFSTSGLAGLVGGVRSVQKAGEREKGEKQAAMQNFFKQKFAELQGGSQTPSVPATTRRPMQMDQADLILQNLGFSKEIPDDLTMQLIRTNKEAREARRQQVRAYRFAKSAVNKALKEQTQAQNFLTSAGITPYSQASAQLLLNAALQSSKKKG